MQARLFSSMYLWLCLSDFPRQEALTRSPGRRSLVGRAYVVARYAQAKPLAETLEVLDGPLDSRRKATTFPEAPRRIEQHGEALRPRQQLPGELETLQVELGLAGARAGDVASGPREARDEAGLHGITYDREDDRRIRRSLARRARAVREEDMDDIHLRGGQLPGKRLEPAGIALGETVDDLEIAPLHPPQFLQAGKKRR